MEFAMDNKYGLGSTKVATEHHETHHKTPEIHAVQCKFCGSSDIVLSPTMQDHLCNACGEWQNDVPQGYSTGRSSDY
jgi:ribosomal protein S27E